MAKTLPLTSVILPLISLSACNTTNASTGPEVAGPAKTLQRGAASWYGPGFNGRKTANGERFNSGAMTAAHRSLPFGTKVRVLHEASGRSVVVRINDRGPFARGRIIDLAAGPARALGISGTAYVSLQPVE